MNSKPRINKNLLWEYDLTNFDYTKNCDIVVARVIELGTKKDFTAIENFYGKSKLKRIIRDKIKYLNDKDMNFASIYYKIDIESMYCYKRTRSREKYLGIKLKNKFQG